MCPSFDALRQFIVREVNILRVRLKFILYSLIRQVSKFVLFRNVLVVFSGGRFGASVHALANYEYALENIGNYKIVLVTGKKEDIGYWAKSFKGAVYLHFANAILTDNGLPYSVNLKKKKVVQTWHGLTIKHIGLDDKALMARLSEVEATAMKKQWADTDLTICSGDRVREIMIQAFGVEHHKAVIATPPYIRKVVSAQSSKAKKSVNQNRSILYLPTYRDWANDRSWDLFENEQLVHYFIENEVKIYYKYHPMDNDLLDKSMHENFVRIEGDYFEVLQECDFLITDYSSAVFEAVLLGVVPVLYAVDYLEYKARRGIYDHWIYSTISRLDKCQTIEDVANIFKLAQVRSQDIDRITNSYFPGYKESANESVIESFFHSNYGAE